MPKASVSSFSITECGGEDGVAAGDDVEGRDLLRDVHGVGEGQDGGGDEVHAGSCRGQPGHHRKGLEHLVGVAQEVLSGVEE